MSLFVESAAVRWYAEGFELGAAGARETQRKGRPRLKAMRPHWTRGIKDGAFVRTTFVQAYARQLACGDVK